MLLHYLPLFTLIYGTKCTDLLVDTPLGKVLGFLDTSYGCRNFLSFEGIPYAKQPTRFKESEPIELWDGTWNASMSTTCAQILLTTPRTIIGTEDCLHINIYVPRDTINPDENLDVVVHIHGGRFFSEGSGTSYAKPHFAMDKDIIFVTFNYRLGVLGFLSTGDNVVPGNNGLKDQVLALKWIQQNIASFGGNPNSVTLNGLSSGAASVHFHYFSEQSTGLFHRGIIQSGTALNPWAIVENSSQKAVKLAETVECPTNTSLELVNCLQSVNVEKILNTIDVFFGYEFLPIDPFGPVVEQGDSPFIKDYPYILLTKGELQDLPLIVSNTEDEGLMIVSKLDGEDFTNFDNNWAELAPLLFDFNNTLSPVFWPNVTDKLRHFFYGDLHISEERGYMMINPLSQRYFYYDTETVLRLQSNASVSDVFYYKFAYPGDRSNNPKQYVEHMNEIKYMFGGVVNLTENELKMKDLIWDMIARYAKTREATFGNTKWLPTSPEEHIYLFVFGIEDEDINLWTTKQFTDNEFWQSLNFSENENLLKHRE